MARIEVIHAYRRLYRAALGAVCRSYPASTGVRTMLRAAFRAKNATFDERAVKRTVWFLNYAARDTGVEHRIVKNILHVHFWKVRLASGSRPTWTDLQAGGSRTKPTALVGSGSTYAHYEKTIEMLNRTMGLCLPLR